MCRPSVSNKMGWKVPAATVMTRVGTGTVTTPLLGTGNLSNVLAATAVALEFDVPLDVVVDCAARLGPARHRGELLRLPGGVTLIDDSYNSSPAALKRALDVVASATGSARKVAVLGEMLELGDHSAGLHRECGVAAHAAGLHFLIAVGGPAAAALAAAAVDAGMPAASVSHVASSGEAAALALERVRPGDLVLVKGSRGIGTDAVVERLERGVRLMLYHLLYPLHTQIGVLNVTRYITFRTAAASLTALVISLVLGPVMIRKLREFQIGQVIRQEGPATHRTKAGTPTMGGLLILTAAVVPTLLWAESHQSLHLDCGDRDAGVRPDWLR